MPFTGYHYQINFTLQYGSGTDTNRTVYLESKSEPDFDDILITSSDGTTLWDYWLETEFLEAGTSAVIWLEVGEDLRDHPVQFYLYWGNPDAERGSNGTATFLAWDDFDLGYEIGDSPKASRGWDIGNDAGDGEKLEIASNPSPRTDKSLYFSDVAAPWIYISTDLSILYQNLAIHCFVRWDYHPTTKGVTCPSASGSSLYSAALDAQTMHYEYLNPSSVRTDFNPPIIFVEDQWFHIKTSLYGNTSAAAAAAVDGVSSAGGVKTNNNGYNLIGISTTSGYQNDFYIDEFFIRRCWFPDTTHTATLDFSALEYAPEPALRHWELRFIFFWVGLAMIFVPIALIAGRYIKGGSIISAMVVILVGCALLMASGSEMVGEP